jgi:hypothetical protein
MKTTLVAAASWTVFALWTSVAAPQSPATSPQSAKAQVKKSQSGTAWTIDEALEQLRLYPRDAYLQYIVLQLARRQGRLEEICRQVTDPSENLWRQQRNQRAGGVDLFSIFSGALAVQESLQLDAMRSEMPQSRPGIPPRQPGAPRPEMPRPKRVSISELSGPTIKSHPWEQMLGGKQPALSQLARSVPQDFYFAEFRSLNKLLDVIDVADLWSKYAFNQSTQEARSQRLGERLKRQLAMKTDPLFRPVYDSIVGEVAICGSEPFLAEGSDVTMLFRIKQEALFKARMNGLLAEAAGSRPDVKRTTGEFQGVPFVHLETADREIHVFSAYPKPELHVRSNSRAAFERVLETILGGAPALGDSKEFAFIRTLMPQGAAEEDGFIYLSDPFIRRLVGPRLKLTERRRMLCHNHLAMIGHAALLYRTEHGESPASLEMLAQAKCSPGAFGEGKLVCPDGGHYSLAADGRTGACSHHGQARSLTPCLETPLDEVSGEEAEQYKVFMEEYNQYWRTFFDPIAIRMQITPERYRLETIVLPLIDNSIYTGLASHLGGPPEPLDALPVPPRNIFSVGLRFNKQALLETTGLKEALLDTNAPRGLRHFFGMPAEALVKLGIQEFLTKGIGNQAALHLYDAAQLFDLNVPQMLGTTIGSFNRRDFDFELLVGLLVASFNSPVYLSVPVQDAAVVDRFLDRLDRVLAAWARERIGGGGMFFELQQDFFRLAGRVEPRIRAYCFQFGPVKFRIFWARIGSALYIASKPFILKDLATMPSPQPLSPRERGLQAHGMVKIRANHWNEVLPDFRLAWAENNRQACIQNLGPLSSVARALTARPLNARSDSVTRPAHDQAILGSASTYLGYQPFCPEGGHYVLSEDGKTFTCTVHGSALAPTQPAQPAGQSTSANVLEHFKGLTINLTFLADGLHAVVEMNR